MILDFRLPWSSDQGMNTDLTTIDISQTHQLRYPEARKKAEVIAVEMAQQYGVKWWWEASTIHFKGEGKSAGVRGFLVVSNNAVRIKISLPLLGIMWRSAIENSVKEQLSKLIVPPNLD